MAASTLVDQPRPVRQGEELDAGALAAYLEGLFPGITATGLQVEQYPSGHSNLTYLLRVGEQELILRRPPFGAKIKSAHDMGREYQILSHLHPVYSKAPRVVAYCPDHSVLGAPFYIMERLRGIILRGPEPKGMDLNPETMRRLCENFADNLAAIHQVDYQAAGLGDLGHPEGYVRRQVEGWTQRYRNARTDDVPDIERVAAWLADHMPPESGAALIHNDYKYDNLVLNPAELTEITGVLDWEMATIGDPLMDLGTSLGYWIDPDDPPELQALRFGPTNLPGNLTRVELAERYARHTGQGLEHLSFYYAYALFKIAVIVQQIYARYKAGFTKDERFAPLIFAVYALGSAGRRVIETGRVEA